MLRCKLANSAFSLLELIITIAILSAGITVILQAIAISSRTTGLSGDMVKAVFIAEDKLQEIDFKEKKGLIKQEPYESKGEFEKFKWKNILGFDTDLSLYNMNFVVNWQRSNKTQEINVRTYLR